MDNPRSKRKYQTAKMTVEEANAAWLRKKPPVIPDKGHPWKRGLACGPKQVDLII